MSCICCWNDKGEHKRNSFQSVVDDLIYIIVTKLKPLIMEKVKYRNKRDLVLTLGCFAIGFISCYFLFGFYLKQAYNTVGIEQTIEPSISITETRIQHSTIPTIPVPINNNLLKSEILVFPTISPSSVIKLKNDLENLYSNFEQTIKSCLGESCFDEKVDYPSGEKIERIGILGPLRSGGNSIVNIVKSSIPHSNKNKKIDIIYDTNVPAYGYGKNHGWTRIIRLVRRLVPHSSLLLSHSNDDLMELQMRQLIRWHCRLNHVAAHTKMLTVFIEDLIERPVTEFHNILTFIDAKFSREDMIKAIDDYKVALEKDIGLKFFSHTSLTDEVFGDTSHSPDSSYSTHPLSETAITAAITALQTEFKKSENLSKWPCESFKDLEKEKNGQAPGLLPMHSSMLSANCSDSFVTCSVRFDVSGG